MKIEQAKQKAMKLFQRDDYQQLFEMLHDEVYDGYGPYRKRDNEDGCPVFLIIGDALEDFQLPFGSQNVSVLLNPFEIGGHAASIGSTYCEENYRDISLAVCVMRGVVVLVYEYEAYDPLSPGNIHKNSDLTDIHEYHHMADFYDMLDCYRDFRKFRDERQEAEKEVELQKRYAGKFSFRGVK